MRMTLWQEVRWAIAVMLLDWILRLTRREATDAMTAAIANLADEFHNDPRHDTVPMRARP